MIWIIVIIVITLWIGLVIGNKIGRSYMESCYQSVVNDMAKMLEVGQVDELIQKYKGQREVLSQLRSMLNDLKDDDGRNKS